MATRLHGTNAVVPLVRAGFTLLELVAIIAVTAVVASVLTSALRTYRVRSEVERALSSAATIQEWVVREFNRHGEIPRHDDRWSPTPSSRNSQASIRFVDGRVELRFGEDMTGPLAGRILTLTPFETATLEVVWLCGTREPPPGLNPLGFSAGGAQPTRGTTTVEMKYLPNRCR